MSTPSVAPGDPYSPYPHLDRANHEIIAAEQSVLGGMMLSQDAVIDVPRILDREDFYRPAHAAIWDAIMALADQGEPADAITVSGELERRNHLVAVGGAPYLHTLISTVPTAANATFYADEVKRVAIRRVIAQQGQRLVQLADSGAGADDLDEQVARSFETCMTAGDGPGAAESRPVGDDDELMDEFVANLGKRPESAFSTGIDDLDLAMIAKKGALILLSADTGVGKSLLAAQVARHYARDRGERVLFHSLEMRRDEMVERDMSAESGVPLASITGMQHLGSDDHDRIVNETVPAYREWGSRLHYVDGRVSVAEVRRNAQRLAHEHRATGGIGLIVVDYIQIMHRPSGVSIERDDLALGAMTSALKDLAMDLGGVVIAVSQFSREGSKSGTPQTHHLKGSSSLGQDADVVALMHDVAKDDDTRIGEVDVLLPKVRKGVSGKTVTIAECRHLAHFRDLGENERSEMSADERAAAGPPPIPA